MGFDLNVRIVSLFVLNLKCKQICKVRVTKIMTEKVV